MTDLTFRLLKAGEIDCRVATVTEKGISLLLYKDARVDMNILDETVGCMNWQRSHETIDGKLFCTISIYDEKKGAWVSKQDVGSEGQIEKDKSVCSDSFKRSGFCWGIGRELYSAPFIWIPSDKCNITKSGDKLKCYDSFRVTQILYDENRDIVALAIKNEKRGELCFVMDNRKKDKK